MLFKLTILFCLCLSALCVAASTTDDADISGKLTGAWKGEGKAFGMSTRPVMIWESALGGQFMKLTYRNEMMSAKGDVRVFEGHAYYKSLGGGKYRATWFDSQGAVHPIEATFDGVTLTSNWGTRETELGRTTYRLVNPKAIEVVDFVQTKDGTWKEFSRATLRKN
jgi:hypothetical protein